MKSLKPLDARKRIWRHNSFLGHTAMTRRQMSNMLNADSVSDEAKETAERILNLSLKLSEQLKTRIDP